MSIFHESLVSDFVTEYFWHGCKSLLACVSNFSSGDKNNGILVVSVGGNVITRESFKSYGNNCRIKCAWHPSDKMLALGLSDGLLALWDCESDPSTVNNCSSKIDCLEWSLDGQLLIVADESGTIHLWKKFQSSFKLLWSLNKGEKIRLFRFNVQHSSTTIRDSYNAAASGGASMFLCVSESGSLFFGNESGQLDLVGGDKLSIQSILVEKDYCLLVSVDLNMSKYAVTPKGLFLDKEVKLSAGNTFDQQRITCILIKDDVYAVNYGGSSVKLIDWITDDIYDLTVPDTFDMRINSISYCYDNKLLAAGSDTGHVFLWKLKSSSGSLDEYQWQTVAKVSLGGSLDSILWSYYGNVLAMKKKNSLMILKEKKTIYSFNGDIGLVQFSSKDLLVYHAINSTSEIMTLDFDITNLLTCGAFFLLSDSKKVYLYKLGLESNSIEKKSEFDLDLPVIGIDTDSVFCLVKQNFIVYSYDGVIKQTIQLENKEVAFISSYSNKSFVCLLSSEKVLYVLDISKREKKLVSKKDLQEFTSANISQISCNKNGSMVLLTDKDGKIYLFDVSLDRFEIIDIGNCLNENFHWDILDERFLMAETENNNQIILKFFLIDLQNLKAYKYDEMMLNQQVELVLGCSRPYCIIAKKESDFGRLDCRKQIITEFSSFDVVGMEKTILDFGLLLLSGKVEEGVKIANHIGGLKPWESAARMSVKSGNIDMAIKCLGMLRMPHIIQYIRYFDDDHKLLVIAEALGMNSDAKKLSSIKNKRNMIEFYQAKGEHDLARDFVQKHHRISLKNCYYKQAQYYEDLDDLEKALENYELANVSSSDDPTISEKGKEKIMKLWWARYMESQNLLSSSKMLYKECQDVESMVRVMCLLGELDMAEREAEKHDSKAAYFHLAKYYHSNGSLKNAILYYGKASCYHHACRIAKQNRMFTEMQQIALLGGKELMLEIANFFHENEMLDKACNLFYKAGHYTKAVELCIQSNQEYLLDMIASDINSHGDVNALEKLARYFEKKGDASRTVDLFLKANQIEEALKVVQSRRVPLNETLADKLSKKIDKIADDRKSKLHLQVAQICLDQNSYQLACKKFTQAGDRIMAMNALLKSGDTEKIMFFASVSGQKHKEIYVMAANYLSTLPWQEQENEEILKNIITFYTKAKSYESLALFYESFAHNQIDLFSDYEKAIGSLKEAFKIRGSKIDQNNSNNRLKAETIQKKIVQVQGFVKAQERIRQNPLDTTEMEEYWNRISMETNELIVRKGDVLGTMIKAAKSQQNQAKVEELLQVLIKTVKRSQVQNYVEEDILKEYQSLIAAAVANSTKAQIEIN